MVSTMTRYAEALEKLRAEADECANRIAESNRSVFQHLGEGVISGKNDGPLLTLQQQISDDMERLKQIVTEAGTLRVTHV